MPERWLSVKEISEHLNISPKTVYSWLDKKKIPAHKLGNKVWRFKISEVDSWVTKSGNKTKKTRNKK